MLSLASELFRRGTGSGLGLPPVAKVLAVLAIVVAGCGAPATLAADRGCLPRPGAWMERFKQALAFPMYGAAVWLVWVLVRQVGADAIAPALGGMVLIAFAAWLYASTRAGGGRSRRLGASAAVVVVPLALVGGHTVVATGGASPEVGKPAPAFSGKTAAGETIELADLRGKTVVLEWSNHKCPYVVKHYEQSGNIPKLQKAAAGLCRPRRITLWQTERLSDFYPEMLRLLGSGASPA